MFTSSPASPNNTDKLNFLNFSNYSILLPPRIHLLFNIALFADPVFKTTIPVWKTGYIFQAEECFTPWVYLPNRNLPPFPKDKQIQHNLYIKVLEYIFLVLAKLLFLIFKLTLILKRQYTYRVLLDWLSFY